VAEGTIDPVQVAVLRGRVFAAGGGPALGGVRVTVADHPEYGYTLTAPDGTYTLVVNGGAPLTVDFQLDGRLGVQRTQDVPWQMYVQVDDVLLIALDSKVTTIDLTSSAPIQVATGNPVTDADGTRQATLMFAKGTSATMRLSDGTTQPLTELKVRATEYTVGPNGDKAMPAELPPSSAYTYAVEFSVDAALQAHATDVAFSKPVVSYVDNFLDFAAGTLVPVAYYDKTKQAWVPSPNGVVLQIVAVVAGVAQVDVTGDGVPDTDAALDKWGISNDELRELGSRYPVGKSLWRVAVQHFTPWDCNWPYGCKGPGCDPPKQPPPPPPPPCDHPCQGAGSIIGYLNQTVGEDVPLVGTPFSLQYASDRSPGYREAYTLRLALTGASISPSLARVDLRVTVGGRVFTQSFAPAPNLTHTFTWDGNDAFGRRLEGAQLAHVRIGYVYPAVYLEPAEFRVSFMQFGGAPLTADRTRRQLTVWQEYDRVLGVLGGGSDALGEWTLSIHHSYDPQAKMLYLGDGVRRTAEGVRPEITTVAGTGDPLTPGDGTALRTGIGYVRGVASAADGSFYIAADNGLIRRVTPDGRIATVAGGGSPADGIGDGLPATQARLASPGDVAIADDGTLYISDTGNARIRRVAPNGVITTIAGGGDPTTLGDGDSATSASLSLPRGIALGMDGTVFVADTGHNRVRQITPDGRIATAAGGGSPADGLGDGGQAPAAALDRPYDVAVDAQGVLYIADGLHHRIRAVTPDGRITTLAGNGQPGASGNGGPSTNAQIGEPQGIAVAADGTVYFADRLHHVVRRVTNGIIAGAAGTGASGFGGDLGPPSQARLSFPQDVAVGSNGSLFIADAANYRIRRFHAPLPGFVDTDISIPSEDGAQLYHFDENGRHLGTLDAVTGAVLYSFSYDSSGRLASVSDRGGNVTRIVRTADGTPTAIVAPGGQTTALSLNGDARLVSIANPAGNTTSLSYSGALLETLTEPGGGVHHYSYDSFGRLVNVQSPNGRTQALTRTDLASGVTIGVTTGLGRQTHYTFEQLPTGGYRRTVEAPSGEVTTLVAGHDGRTTTTHPDGSTTALTFGGDPRWGMLAPTVALKVTDPGGDLVRELTEQRTAVLSGSDPVGDLVRLGDTVTTGDDTSTYQYEAATRRLTQTTPQGRQTATVLDSAGRPERFEAPGRAALLWSYDGSGRLAKLEQGSESWTYAYDAKNRLTSLTDAEGHVTTYAYDAADRLTGVTLPSNRSYLFTTDADGRRTSVTMPSGAAHSFRYTQGGLLKRYQPPGNDPFVTTFDADGTRTGVDFPSGAHESFAHDAGGRLSAILAPGSSTSFAYASSAPGPATITRTPSIGQAETLTRTFAWDGLARLTFSGAASGQFDYLYDNRFDLVQLRLDTEPQIVLERDRDGLLTKYGPFTFTRGASGDPTRIADTAMTLDLSYDDLGHMTQRKQTVAGIERYDEQLGYDAAGRITGKVETIAGETHTYAYSYDGDGRLTAVTRDGSSAESYGYDQNGNRTSAGAENANYDVQDRLTQRGATGYSFDIDGYLTGRGSDSFGYGRQGELRSATVGGTQVEYSYDGLGRRVARTAGGGTTQYLYGDPDNPFLVTNSRSGGVLTTYFYDEGGRLFAFDRGSSRYYVGSDHVGTPRVVTDASGRVVKKLEYDSFGRLLSDTEPAFDLPIGFGGGLADPVTGLVRFGLRDYEPASGRWTARNPALYTGLEANLYQYAGSNPVGLSDTSGLPSVEASLYEGIGVGAKLAVDSNGISFCLEVGLGIGGGVSVDPFESIDKTGVSDVAEATLGIGPVGGTVKAELDDCGNATVEGKGCVGPFCAKRKTNLVDPDADPAYGAEVTGDEFGKNVKDLFKRTGLKAEAKVAAKGCVAHQW
jgi:RHS repeat-associated protein